MYHIILFILAFLPCTSYSAQTHRPRLSKTVEIILQKKYMPRLQDDFFQITAYLQDHQFEARKHIAQYLLNLGVPVDCQRALDGATPFLVATMWDKIKTMRWLLDKGACIFASDAKGSDVYRYTRCAHTSEPLYFIMNYLAARWTKHILYTIFEQESGLHTKELAHTIFDYADATPTQEQLDWALDQAIVDHNKDRVAFFLEQGAGINHISQIYPGKTPLTMAIPEIRVLCGPKKDTEMLLEIIQLLLNNKANIMHVDASETNIDRYMYAEFNWDLAGPYDPLTSYPVGAQVLKIVEQHKLALLEECKQKEHADELERSS